MKLNMNGNENELKTWSELFVHAKRMKKFGCTYFDVYQLIVLMESVDHDVDRST